ncbi:MAG: molybdate ABC transporter substrate-binding protein [Leptolyngbyaceae cyanobacterium]
MQRRQCLTFILIWLMTVGCAPRAPLALSGAESSEATITVSAAASLQDALDAIAPEFGKAYPNITVDYNFASSGALQRQIEQGAPADIFFSAASKQMDALEDLIVSDSRQDVVANSLVLIAPSASTLSLTDIAQIKDADVGQIAVGEFRSVPAGQYAQQVFQNLKLLDALAPKFVFGNNVRSVLSAVESGNVDLGIVYATDAALSERVKVLTTVPADVHQPIVYPAAVIQGSAYGEAAQTFIDFLITEPAQTVFAEFGFDPAFL